MGVVPTGRRVICGALAVGLLGAALAITPGGAAAAGETDEPQIIGGGQASPGEYPYMAGLLIRGVNSRYFAQFCGASVIAPTIVMTAAHCVKGESAGGIDVLTGSIDLDAFDGQRIGAKYIFMHPGYKHSTSKNDVAVIELKTPTTATPVDLVAADEGPLWTPGTTSTVTGWGDTTNGTGAYAHRLREVDVPIVSDAQCKSNYGSAVIGSVMVCAGNFAQGGKDSCQGDSGGPLIVKDGGRPVQVGIVSWGIQCALAGYPGVYTQVGAMRGFLEPFVHGGFRDLPTWLKAAGAWLFDNDYSEGYPDLTFREGRRITRGQFINMLFAITGPHGAVGPNGFPDVPPWLDPAVDWAKDGNVVEGYPNGTFKPDRNITRAEVANILWKLFGQQGATPHSFDDVPGWVATAVSWLVEEGYATGFESKYKPGQPITRGQSAFQLFNIYGP